MQRSSCTAMHPIARTSAVCASTVPLLPQLLCSASVDTKQPLEQTSSSSSRDISSRAFPLVDRCCTAHLCQPIASAAVDDADAVSSCDTRRSACADICERTSQGSALLSAVHGSRRGCGRWNSCGRRRRRSSPRPTRGNSTFRLATAASPRSACPKFRSIQWCRLCDTRSLSSAALLRQQTVRRVSR